MATLSVCGGDKGGVPNCGLLSSSPHLKTNLIRSVASNPAPTTGSRE